MNARQILAELEQEYVATANLLEIVPDKRLNFKPHEKAMPLGQLAFHVAEVTGRMLSIGKAGEIEVADLIQHPIPDTKDQIMVRFEKSIETTKALLNNSDTNWLEQEWKLTKDGHTIAEMPVQGYIRTFVLNHFIHHRGELVSYLRQLNQIIPSVYGPTADVNPFA